jgi:hypothetical protein
VLIDLQGGIPHETAHPAQDCRYGTS